IVVPRTGMSSTILASSIPAKGKILKLISEVQQMDWKTIDQEIADDERCEEYENRKSIIEDEIERIEL
ncbi:unnamed protein product, partial [Onchocerca ochengi]